MRKGNTFLGGLYKGNQYIGEVYKGTQHLNSFGFPKPVTGASPITLPDARAKALTKNKLSGNSVRTITIDGTEYVVPSDITLLEYIQSSGTQYIDTGISPAGKKIGAVIDFQYTDTSRTTGGVFGSNKSDGTDNCQFTVYNSKWRIKLNNYATYGATYNTVRHTARCNMPDGTSLDSTVYTTTQYTIASVNTNNVYVGACNYGSSSTNTYTLVGKLYSAKVYDDTTLVRAFYPAKNSSNVVGMYDFVTGQFFTNAGTGSFTAGASLPTPEHPLGVKSVGDRTENLFNPDNAGTRYQNGWYSNGGTIVNSVINNRTITIPCSEGDVFTFKHYTEASGARYFWIYSDAVAIGEPCSAMYGTTISINAVTTTAAPSNAKYIGICFWRTTAGTVQSAADDFVVVKGSTAPTEYIPYGYKLTELLASNCGMVDMGTLDIGKTAYGCSFEKSDIAQTDTNAYITGYTLGRGDKTFRIVPVVSTVYVGIQDERFADMTIEQIKELLSGKYLYYQRTTDDTWQAPQTVTTYIDKPLNKVGTYADSFDFADGGHVEGVGVKVFDGTEEWQIGQSFTDGTYRTFLSMSFPSVDSATLCSHFEQGQFSDRNQANQGNKLYINTTSIQIRSTQFDSPVSAKSWLAAQYAAGTPVTVWYPLATPVTTQHTAVPVTPAQGTNYIESTNTVKASNIEAEYLRKTP